MSFDTSSIGAEPTSALQLDQTKLTSYLQTTLSDLFSSTARLDIKQLTYGLSNPTYIIRAAEKTYVLRKKPPGKLLPSAHQIEREVQVLKALQSTNVPIPTVIHFCTNDEIIGTPFYLMSHVKGKVYTDPNFPQLTVEERMEAYNSMAETLAKLHDVDVEKVGLATFGNPRGYCQRQVKRWWKQYEKSIPIPSVRMNRLKDWLLKTIPKTDQQPIRPTVAHGDPSLANLIFVGSKVRALVDWELSTLGDVWADLAYNCLSYFGPSSETLPIIIDPLMPGIPSEEEYVAYYAQLRKIDVPSQQDWAFYKGLALFRLASICQGVGARATQGNASSERAQEVGSLENVDLLAKRGLEILQSASSPNSTYLTSSLDFGPFEVRPKTKDLIQRLSRFMDRFIFPLEEEVEQHETSEDRWKVFPKTKALKKEAQSQGLWNLFIPPGMQSEIWKMDGLSLEDKKLLSGYGLTNVEYHFVAELMGRCLWASEIFNCQAPDTGNMEILSRFGTPQQKVEYLVPLLKGECRSCFGMTEKMVASSDARNIQSSIEVSAENQLTLSGRKWWTTGALHPEVQFCIFMGKTDPSQPAYRQQTMVLVPMNTPGIRVRRQMLQFGYDDAPVGHPEIDFHNVRVSMRNMLGRRGQGFEIAQSRLGPGRLHHCMRLVGLGKRSLEIAKDRLGTRIAFGSLLSEKSSVQMSFGSAAIDLRAARVLVLSAADSLDRHGGKVARYHIAAAKVFVPKTIAKIIDQCMQYYGGAGLSNVVPLSRMYAGARALRIADGPDEVHTITIGKSELEDKIFVSNL